MVHLSTVVQNEELLINVYIKKETWKGLLSLEEGEIAMS